MRCVLMSARPPTLMVAATSASGAASTCCHVGKLALREAKALWEVRSVVFWDRMVRTSESSTLVWMLPHLQGTVRVNTLLYDSWNVASCLVMQTV